MSSDVALPTAPPSRRPSSRLRTRIAALIALPVVALVVVSSQNLSRLRDQSDAAQESAELIERTIPLSRLLFQLRLEQSLATTTIQLRNEGIDAGIVKALFGVDLLDEISRSQSSFRLRLEELAATRGGLPSAPGYWDELAEARGALVSGRLDIAGAERVFGRYEAELAQRIRHEQDRTAVALAQLPSSADLVDRFAAGPYYLDIVDAMARELVTFGRYGLPTLRKDSDRAEFARAVAERNELHREIESRLDDSRLAEWRKHIPPETIANVEALETRALAALGLSSSPGGNTASGDAALFALAPKFMAELIPLSESYSDFGSIEGEDLGRLALAAGERAQSQLRRDALILTLVVVAILAAAAWTLRSIVRPLRLVEERATRVSAGVLDADPLRTRGPREIAIVADAMNDLTDTLRRFVHQTSALSAGKLEAVGSEPLRGALGVAVNDAIGQLAAMTYQLQQSEERAKAIVEHAGDAIFTVDHLGILRTANHAGALLLRARADQLIGAPLADHGIDLLDTGEAIIHSGDQTRHVAVSVSEIAGTNLRTVVARDVTDSKERESRLAYQAQHDHLTGLANRAELSVRLASRIHGGGTPVAFFVDLDGFKAINDTWGHTIGDELLTGFAARFRAALRPGDLAARYGGDEFVAVVDDLPNPDAALGLARQLIAAVEEPFVLSACTVAISASVGIALTEHGISAGELLRRADRAAYDAKASGKGQAQVYSATTADRTAT